MNGNPPVLVASDLPAQCVEEELWEIFSGFGPVLEVLKKSDGPSSSPFYALITFANDMEGSNALRHLNGMMFYGKPFKLRFASPHLVGFTETPPLRSMAGAMPMSMPISAPMPGPMPMSVPIQAQGLGAGPSPTPLGKGESIINSLYVKFTSRETGYYITADDLFGIFSKFGVVTSVTIKDLNFDPAAKRQTGYGFVHFSNDMDGMQQAVHASETLNRQTVNGITLSVELSKNLMKQFNGILKNQSKSLLSKVPAAFSGEEMPRAPSLIQPIRSANSGRTPPSYQPALVPPRYQGQPLGGQPSLINTQQLKASGGMTLPDRLPSYTPGATIQSGPPRHPLELQLKSLSSVDSFHCTSNEASPYSRNQSQSVDSGYQMASSESDSHAEMSILKANAPDYVPFGGPDLLAPSQNWRTTTNSAYRGEPSLYSDIGMGRSGSQGTPASNLMKWNSSQSFSSQHSSSVQRGMLSQNVSESQIDYAGIPLPSSNSTGDPNAFRYAPSSRGKSQQQNLPRNYPNGL